MSNGHDHFRDLWSQRRTLACPSQGVLSLAGLSRSTDTELGPKNKRNLT